ncbi:hypothetical protein ACGGZK_05115 [Agromyces sp. MMS24-K17]|uniref:hypothetical protein n=1 Tax=Agromyces sp. MMS24-K17 TaxID=3372850 RepID=UPI003753E8FC
MQPLPVTAPPPTRRPVIVWDLVLTIVLLVVLVGLTAVLFFLSFFLAFAGDSCGAVECNYDVMGTGMVVAMFGPPIVALLALVAAIIVLVLKRIAFWIALVGIVLAVGVFFLGAAITISGVPPTA